MRDPERLFAGNGITEFERELLDAGKNEPMPEPLRQRMEAALGLTGGAAAGAPGQTPVPAAAGVKPGNAAGGARAAQVTTLAKTMKLVWLSAGVVALGFGGGIVGARFFGARFFERATAVPAAGSAQFQAGPAVAPAALPEVNERGPAQVAPAAAGRAARAGTSTSGSVPALALAPASVSVSTSAPSVAVGAPVAPGATSAVAGPGARGVKPALSPVARVRAVAAKHESRPARATVAPVRHPVAQVTSARPEPVSSDGDLRVEIDLIDAARGTLRTGSAARALEILGRYSARFPHGALAPEGVALRVEALMRLGRTAEARTLAQRFVAANPTSPLVERMNRLSSGAPNP